jgi:hypothetical protein
MALMPCPECGSEVSDKALSCPKCGLPLAAAPKEMLIHFDRASGQLFNIGCSVSSGGKVIAKGKQGDTLRIPCTEPMEIEVKVKGWFGTPRLVVQPGERYNAKPRRVGFYLEKVDQIAGI